MRKNLGPRCLTVVAWALVGVVVTAGCGGGGGGATATVTGVICDDASLDALVGATVTSGAASATSGPDGHFSLGTVSGTRRIAVTRADYQPHETTVSLNAGANDLGTVYLAPVLLTANGAVRGRVLRAGSPAVNARIQSGSAEAVSKPDGTFGIYNVGSGERVLSAVSADMQYAGYTVLQVSAGQTITGVNITLSLAPPTPPVF